MAGESARESARRTRERIVRLERRAAAYERGADGEAETARALDRLGDEWVVLHDQRWPGRQLANVDHVAIGPGGIFVIDSKNWAGRVTLEDGRARQNGYPRDREVTKASDAAAAVAELVAPYARHVVPVVCFTGEATASGR